MPGTASAALFKHAGTETGLLEIVTHIDVIYEAHRLVTELIEIAEEQNWFEE